MPHNPTVHLDTILLPIIAHLYGDNLSNPQQALVITTMPANNLAIPQLAIRQLNWTNKTPEDFNKQKFDKKYTLALIIVSNDLPELTYIKSIQQCRDLFAQFCLALVPIESLLDLTAMGFSRVTQDNIEYEGQQFILWQFNLFDYKHLPDWLNSRFWANPENWNKFRW